MRAPLPQQPDVQWAQGYSSGVRSWAAHGIGRVHRRNPDEPWRTLCGVSIPNASRLMHPTADETRDNRCARCAQAMRG